MRISNESHLFQITSSLNGLIIRDVIPSNVCRTSALQFCCKEDLCNSLPIPPLPALTNLLCHHSHCRKNDSRCLNGKSTLIYRSSATESCTVSK